MRVELDTSHNEHGGWAVLRVSDEGIGIAEEDLAGVFEWFARGQNARQTTIEGTGIGLAGMRDIVEQHSGSIALVSWLGKGSTFTVRLPVMPPAPPLASTRVSYGRVDEPDAGS